MGQNKAMAKFFGENLKTLRRIPKIRKYGMRINASIIKTYIFFSKVI